MSAAAGHWAAAAAFHCSFSAPAALLAPLQHAAAMQSLCGVRIDAPELLTAVFVATRDRQTQAALALSNSAWAAISRGCRRLTARFCLHPPGDPRSSLVENPSPPAQLVVPTDDLASLAGWLCRQQQAQQLPPGGIPTSLDIVVADECCCSGLRPGGSLLAAPEAKSLAQEQARQAVATLSGTLEHLHLTTGIDATWLPPLPYLTRMELCFARRRRPHRFAEGKEARLAWLGQPHLLLRPRELSLLSSFHDWPDNDEALKWEAPRFGPSLPPQVTRLEIGGVAGGVHHVATQLHSLEWGPGDDAELWDVPPRAWEAVCQATRLTSLCLVGPWPDDDSQFFSHLGRATQLHSLELQGWSSGCLESFLQPERFQDPAHLYTTLAQFGAALATLTNLTCLKLTELELDACPGDPSGGLAMLACLQELDLSFNGSGAFAGIRALPFGPYQSSLRSLTADGSVGMAAMAQPGHVHALWGMPALTRLDFCCFECEEGDTDEQFEARIAALEAAVKSRLPGVADYSLEWL